MRRKWMMLCVVCAICAVAFAPFALATVTLSIGSKGANVTKVQQRLLQYGYMSGKADGVYGKKTAEAVMKFQRRYNMPADGKVGSATANKLGVTLSGVRSASAQATTVAVSSNVDLLARLVHAEAKGEPYKGKVAVAAVVLNRIKHPSFPNTLYSVVYQKGAFSPISNGSVRKPADKEAIRAAKDALNGVDPTGGAIYFYNPKATGDKWIFTRRVTMTIGAHRFAV